MAGTLVASLASNDPQVQVEVPLGIGSGVSLLCLSLAGVDVGSAWGPATKKWEAAFAEAARAGLAPFLATITTPERPNIRSSGEPPPPRNSMASPPPGDSLDDAVTARPVAPRETGAASPGTPESSVRPKTIPELQADCDAGRLDRCLALAEQYELGNGVAPDRARAARLYERVCAAGRVIGCIRRRNLP